MWRRCGYSDPELVDVLHRAHRRARVRRRRRRHGARYQPDHGAQGFRARTHAGTGGSAAQATARHTHADAHSGADRHRAHQCRSAAPLDAVAGRCAPDQRRAYRGDRQRQHVLFSDGQAVGSGEQPAALCGATAIGQPLDQHATEPHPRQRAAPAQQSAAALQRILRSGAVCVAGAGAAVCAAVAGVLCPQRAGVSGASGGGVIQPCIFCV